MLVEGKYSIPQLIAVAEDVVSKIAASSKLLSNSTGPDSMEDIPVFVKNGVCRAKAFDMSDSSHPLC